MPATCRQIVASSTWLARMTSRANSVSAIHLPRQAQNEQQQSGEHSQAERLAQAAAAVVSSTTATATIRPGYAGVWITLAMGTQCTRTARGAGLPGAITSCGHCCQAQARNLVDFVQRRAPLPRHIVVQARCHRREDVGTLQPRHGNDEREAEFFLLGAGQLLQAPVFR